MNVGEIFDAKVDVVEQKDNESLRGGRGLRCDIRSPQRRAGVDMLVGGRSLVNIERGDRMRLAIVDDFKVFFLQTDNGVALLVPDYYRHQDAVYVDLKRGSRGLRRARLLSGSTRGARAHATYQQRN